MPRRERGTVLYTLEDWPWNSYPAAAGRRMRRPHIFQEGTGLETAVIRLELVFGIQGVGLDKKVPGSNP